MLAAWGFQRGIQERRLASHRAGGGAHCLRRCAAAVWFEVGELREPIESTEARSRRMALFIEHLRDGADFPRTAMGERRDPLRSPRVIIRSGRAGVCRGAPGSGLVADRVAPALVSETSPRSSRASESCVALLPEIRSGPSPVPDALRERPGRNRLQDSRNLRVHRSTLLNPPQGQLDPVLRRPAQPGQEDCSHIGRTAGKLGERLLEGKNDSGRVHRRSGCGSCRRQGWMIRVPPPKRIVRPSKSASAQSFR